MSIRPRGKSGVLYVHYTDHIGRRRKKSANTTERRVAKRIEAKIREEVELLRSGILTPDMVQAREAGSVSLSKHIDAYVAHLKGAERAATTIRDARAYLDAAKDEMGWTRLQDINLDSVMKLQERIKARGRKARTINRYGLSVRAFTRWCVKTGRLVSDPLAHLPRRNEDRDRGYERRALTREEIESLLAEGDKRGRGLLYRLAYYAGLRKSEVARLRWSNVDLDRGWLVIDQGKAKRVDELPIHKELQPHLEAAKYAMGPIHPQALVVPNMPTNHTRQRDFERAGITREDGHGLWADLHSLRCSLATHLVKAGVTVYETQRLMRHADIRTTMKHYARLRLDDLNGALAKIDGEEETEENEALAAGS